MAGMAARAALVALVARPLMALRATAEWVALAVRLALVARVSTQ